MSARVGIFLCAILALEMDWSSMATATLSADTASASPAVPMVANTVDDDLYTVYLIDPDGDSPITQLESSIVGKFAALACARAFNKHERKAGNPMNRQAVVMKQGRAIAVEEAAEVEQEAEKVYQLRFQQAGETDLGIAFWEMDDREDAENLAHNISAADSCTYCVVTEMKPGEDGELEMTGWTYGAFDESCLAENRKN